MADPYVSVVVVARNDDYGGDFLRRVRTFAAFLRAYASGRPDLFELLVVNWNPLPDRPPISDVVDWSMPCPVRVITVPPTLHRQVAQDSPMPVLEYFGKNVGIRRARAPFVLVTNPDIILSHGLVKALARRDLDPAAFYRADRLDFVHRSDMDGLTVADYYRRAVDEGFQSLVRGATGPVARTKNGALVVTRKTDRERVLDSPPGFRLRKANTLRELHVNAAGDFILASKASLVAARGFWERRDTFTHLDAMAVVRLSAQGLAQIVLRQPAFILHIDHPRAEQDERPTVPWDEVMQDLTAIHANRCAAYAEQEGWGLDGVELDELRFNI